MWLIVQFEDVHIRPNRDLKALDQFPRSTILFGAAKFADLYLVSGRERVAFKYDIGAVTQVLRRRAAFEPAA